MQGRPTFQASEAMESQAQQQHLGHIRTTLKAMKFNKIDITKRLCGVLFIGNLKSIVQYFNMVVELKEGLTGG